MKEKIKGKSYRWKEGIFQNALKSLPKLLNLKPDNVLKTIYHFIMTLKFKKMNRDGVDVEFFKTAIVGSIF